MQPRCSAKITDNHPIWGPPSNHTHTQNVSKIQPIRGPQNEPSKGLDLDQQKAKNWSKSELKTLTNLQLAIQLLFTLHGGYIPICLSSVFWPPHCPLLVPLTPFYLPVCCPQNTPFAGHKKDHTRVLGGHLEDCKWARRGPPSAGYWTREEGGARATRGPLEGL
jgi:hypothetical protein